MNNIIPLPPSRGEGGNSYFLSLVREAETAAKEASEHLGCFHKRSVTEDECKNAISSLEKFSDALEKEARFFRSNESEELVQIKYEALVSITHTIGIVDHLSMEIETLTWISETDHFREYINQRKAVRTAINEMTQVLQEHWGKMAKISQELP